MASVTMLLPIKFHCLPDLALVIGEPWGEREEPKAELVDIAFEHPSEGPMVLYHVVLQSSNIKIITDLLKYKDVWDDVLGFHCHQTPKILIYGHSCLKAHVALPRAGQVPCQAQRSVKIAW